ncbi:uncharacterized protein N7515_005679 [Penicillium bovifimosum]|uniref:Uncharacterized protein n=1 Tax=Penicillium bovifimosum TaxID=126998 RepID=A0A9W9GT88_9EURO|nr:uncharacterized protein N7515_005679 [Penicillium bovifimosum]KAJ5129640.1 hypothetical protein N7515_005679 [Penicillium bovifimosum]
MSNRAPPPPSYLMTTATAGRNPDFCPWRSSHGVIYDTADSDALWLTVELSASMNALDDTSLLQFVLRQIQMSHAQVDLRAQHYLRPGCLSLPAMVGSEGSYAECQAATSWVVIGWIEQVRAGTAWLDRNALFGPR